MEGMMEGAPMEGAEEGAQGGDAAQAVMDVSKGISGIAKALMQVSPEASKAMEALNQQFQEIINSISQGGGSAGGAPAMAASPEQGGKSGAVLASPAGVR